MAVIKAIGGIAAPIASKKLQRQEGVIKLLRDFGIDPEHPPSDYSGIYVYVLVDYGVGKPQEILELLRQEEIKQTFRDAFEQDNPSVLLSKGESYVEAYALGDDIKALGIDWKREFAEFSAIFLQVVGRSRTPAQVRSDQKLDSMQNSMETLHQRLDRIPTLEGMRLELASLLPQLLPAVNGVEVEVERKCRAYALAQQMRGWFETLDYKFESHEIWEAGYFEWVITYSVGRRKFNRVLVRGVDSTADLADLDELRESVEQQKADEGWLVTTRRVSSAVREKLQSTELRDLACYTFDELVDQDADFSGYLNWLEREIQQREIDRYYVPLACTQEEFDPKSRRSLGRSRYGEAEGWIDRYVDQWLDDPTKEHVSILGEFGTGKTWFAFHYAGKALERYKEAQSQGLKRPRLPLVIPLWDYAKAVSVESLFSEFFFRKHEIGLSGYSAFEQLNRMGRLLLIFDGFDEMAARIDRQQMINNFWEMAKIVVPGAKAILTCRTEHFPEAQQGRAVLNAELQASTANLTGESPQFEVLELEPFSDDQIRQVFSAKASEATVEEVLSNPQLLDLARRPVMSDLILAALPDIEAGEPVDLARIYLYAVRQKMQRDIKAERTFTSLADKLYFMCELSWDMIATDRMSLNYRLFPERLRRLFGERVAEDKDLDHWHFDMMGQTLLIRNAEGDYRPAHRSLLEFFVAYKLVAELGVLAPDFTAVAQDQSNINAQAALQDYTWHDYFQRLLNDEKQPHPIAPLREFKVGDLTEACRLLAPAPIAKAILDLAIPMLDKAVMGERLISLIQETRNKSGQAVGYFGGNIARLLVGVNPWALESCDLHDTVIAGMNFAQVSLLQTNLTGATLTECMFSKVLGTPETLAISPDGLIVIGDNAGRLQLWNEHGRELWLVEGHENRVLSVAISPDGSWIASGGDDRTVKRWAVDDGRCLQTLEGHEDWVKSVAISPDGSWIASGGGDRMVKRWAVEDGRCLQTLEGHEHWVLSVAISPDGSWIASGGGDRTVKRWAMEDGRCLQTLEGHEDWVKSVAISPDGSWIASGGGDRTVKRWAVEDGRCLQTLEGHEHLVWSVAISPDGSWIASSSYDQSVRIWDFLISKCLQILDHRLYATAEITDVSGLMSAQKSILLHMGAFERDSATVAGS